MSVRLHIDIPRPFLLPLSGLELERLMWRVRCTVHSYLGAAIRVTVLMTTVDWKECWILYEIIINVSLSPFSLEEEGMARGHL